MHEHTWKPIFVWPGRYRCSGCDAVGYRSTTADLAIGRADRITPYLCAKQVNGAACGQAAVFVTKDKGKSRCHEHRDPRP